jgi:hypothetical protein
MPERVSRRTVIVLVMLVVATGAAVVAAVASDGPTPTTSTATLPPTSVAVPTSTTTPGVVPTGSGPEAFTTTSAPGPLQVLVTSVACVRYAGDGYAVGWRLENHSGRPVAGSLVGQLDKDGQVTLLAPSIRVGAGETFTPERPMTVAGGAADSVSLIWTVPGYPQVRSFPTGAASCPTDPADKRLATTST